MSLESILEAIRTTGQEQVNRIELAAQAQVNEILDSAKREADQIRSQACNEAAPPVARERSRLLHQARLAALRISGEARQEFIDTVLERTRARLVGISTEAAYPTVMRRLIQQALKELEGSLSDIRAATAEINPRDLELMREILAEMGLDLPVQADLETWGGLIVRSKEARVVVINTLEARSESALPYLRRFLAALFENQECLISTTVTPVYEP